MMTWTPSATSTAEGSVEALNARLSALVRERQTLRAAHGDRERLEDNRLEIGRLQRLLGAALVARHLPPATA